MDEGEGMGSMKTGSVRERKTSWQEGKAAKGHRECFEWYTLNTVDIAALAA